MLFKCFWTPQINEKQIPFSYNSYIYSYIKKQRTKYSSKYSCIHIFHSSFLKKSHYSSENKISISGGFSRKIFRRPKFQKTGLFCTSCHCLHIRSDKAFFMCDDLEPYLQVYIQLHSDSKNFEFSNFADLVEVSQFLFQAMHQPLNEFKCISLLQARPCVNH